MVIFYLNGCTVASWLPSSSESSASRHHHWWPHTSISLSSSLGFSSWHRLTVGLSLPGTASRQAHAPSRSIDSPSVLSASLGGMTTNESIYRIRMQLLAHILWCLCVPGTVQALKDKAQEDIQTLDTCFSACNVYTIFIYIHVYIHMHTWYIQYYVYINTMQHNIVFIYNVCMDIHVIYAHNIL